VQSIFVCISMHALDDLDHIICLLLSKIKIKAAEEEELAQVFTAELLCFFMREINKLSTDEEGNK